MFTYLYGEENTERHLAGLHLSVKFWERVYNGAKKTNAALLHLVNGDVVRCEYFPPYPDGSLELTSTWEGYLYLNSAGAFSGEFKDDAKFLLDYEREKAAFYYSTCGFLSLEDVEALLETNPTIPREFDENPYCLLGYARGTHGEVPFTNFLTLYDSVKIPSFKARLLELKECAKYTLRKNEGTGNTCMELEDFEEKFENVLAKGQRPLKPGQQPRAVAGYFSWDFKIVNKNGKKYVFLEDTYEDEVFVAEEIERCLERDEVFGKYDISDASKENLSPEQADGALGCIKGKGSVSILTGGPGTGKTRVVAAIAEGITTSYPGIKVRFLSPTGMAAKRMREQMEKEYPLLHIDDISTIHKFLGYGNPFKTEEMKKNISESGLIIIDEASMLDIHIFAQLLRSVDLAKTKVVLVGDVNQLPSIGAGCVMRDLSDLGVPVYKLSVNYRSGDGALIVKNANKIMDGKPLFEYGESFVLKSCGESGFVKAAMENAKDDNAKIISPYRKREINGSCEKVGALVKRAKTSEKSGSSYKIGVRTSSEDAYTPQEGDFVIITKTNYKSGYINGDTGVVTKQELFCCDVCIGKDGRGEDIVKTVPTCDLTLGYGVSVHKSQGSEYESVAIVIPKASPFVTRRMLYTAITRAKGKVILYTTEQDLLKTSLNARDEQRLTLVGISKNG